MTKKGEKPVDDKIAETEPEPCKVCGGTAFIKCPLCVKRDEGKELPLPKDEVCKACKGEGVVPCLCYRMAMQELPKPTITITFEDPMSCQFQVQTTGFHPALLSSQVMLVAEFLKLRVHWETMTKFDMDMIEKSKEEQVSQKKQHDLLKGVPAGGLPKQWRP